MMKLKPVYLVLQLEILHFQCKTLYQGAEAKHCTSKVLPLNTDTHLAFSGLKIRVKSWQNFAQIDALVNKVHEFQELMR